MLILHRWTLTNPREGLDHDCPAAPYAPKPDGELLSKTVSASRPEISAHA